MMNRFFFSTIGSANTVVEFDADYIMLKYTYIDGRDLDTRTKILSPVNTDYLGWSRLSRYPATGDIILDWGGDNTGSGAIDGSTGEAILINLINFRAAYPTDDIIEIDCRCFWYNTVGVQLVVVEATLWKGGAVIKGSPPYQFSNPTSESTVILDSIGSSISLFTQASITEGQRVGIFTYDDATKIGQFS